MAYFTNFLSSVNNNVLPELGRGVFPKVNNIKNSYESNQEKTKQIANELEGKFKRITSALKDVPKRLKEQLKSGKFGESNDLASMFGGMDDLGDIGSMNDLGDLGTTGSDTTINKNYYNIESNNTASSEMVGVNRSFAKFSALQNDLLTKILYNAEISNAFQSEQTKSFYDANLENTRSLIASLGEFKESFYVVAKYYQEIEEQSKIKQLRQNNNYIDKILDPSRVLSNINDGILTSDLMVDMIESKLKDPLGSLITGLSSAIVTGFFPKLVYSINKAAEELPYLIQSKLEAYSNNRSFLPGDMLSKDNILAGIADMIKLNQRQDGRLILNKDTDLHATATFDQLTRRSIVTIIPGYLAKILTSVNVSNYFLEKNLETQMFLSNRFTQSDIANVISRKPKELDVYDHHTGKFIKHSEAIRYLKSSVTSAKNGGNYGGVGYELSSILGKMDGSSKEKAILQAGLVRLASTSNAGNIDLADSNHIIDNLKAITASRFKRRKNESYEQYEARIAKLNSRYDSDSFRSIVSSFSGKISNSESDTDARLASMKDEISELSSKYKSTSDPHERQILLNRINSIKNDYKYLKKFRESSASRLTGAFRKHYYEMNNAYSNSIGNYATETESFAGALTKLDRSPIRAEFIKKNKDSKNSGNNQSSIDPDLNGGGGSGIITSSLEFIAGIGASIHSSFEKTINKVNSIFDNISNFIKTRIFGVDSDKAKDISLFSVISNKIDNLLNPIKKALLGTNNDKVASKFNLFSSLLYSFNNNVLKPFKKALLGTDDDRLAKKTSLLDAIGDRINKSILTPLKGLLLGDKTNASSTSLFDSIMFRLETSVFKPMREFLFGEENAKKSTFRNIRDIFTNSVLNPLKKALLGANSTKDASSTSLFDSIKERINTSILTPFKKLLLGTDDDKLAKEKSLWSSIMFRFNTSVLTPFKKALLGTDDEELARKTSLLDSISDRINTSILTPVKKVLLGTEDDKYASSKTLLSSIMFRMETSVFKPMREFLFGEENAKKSTFRNIGDFIGDRLNKLIYGLDGAKKNTLWGNIKSSFNEFGSFLKNNVFTPIGDFLKNELFVSFKDMVSEIGKEFKYYGSKIKTYLTKDLVIGAKGVMKEILGDETISMIRKTLVDPFKEAVNKLTDSLGGVLKFFMRIPVNFFRGVADSIKLTRLKRGDKFSDEETKRLLDLEKTGSMFDFMRGVNLPFMKSKAKADVINNITAEEHAKFTDRFRDLFTSRNKASNDSSFKHDNSSTNNTASKSSSVSDRFNRSRSSNDDTFNANGSSTNTSKSSSIFDRFNRSRSSNDDTFNTSSSYSNTANKSSTSDLSNKTFLGGDPVENLSKIASHTGKTSSLLDNIYAFAKSNLREVDSNLSTIRKKIVSNAKTLSGPDSVVFSSSNPFVWIGAKIGGMLEIPFKLISSTLSGIANGLRAIADVPKKIIETSFKITGQLVNSASKVFSSLGEVAIQMSTSILTTLGSALTKSVEVLGNVSVHLVNGIGNVLLNLSRTINPILNATSSLMATTLKTLAPVISTLGKLLGELTTHVANLASIFASLGMKLIYGGINTIARIFGGTGNYGKNSGKTKTIVSNDIVKVDVVKWTTMRGSSASNPLYVTVVRAPRKDIASGISNIKERLNDRFNHTDSDTNDSNLTILSKLFGTTKSKNTSNNVENKTSNIITEDILSKSGSTDKNGIFKRISNSFSRFAAKSLIPLYVDTFDRLTSSDNKTGFLSNLRKKFANRTSKDDNSIGIFDKLKSNIKRLSIKAKKSDPKSEDFNLLNSIFATKEQSVKFNDNKENIIKTNTEKKVDDNFVKFGNMFGLGIGKLLLGLASTVKAISELTLVIRAAALAKSAMSGLGKGATWIGDKLIAGKDIIKGKLPEIGEKIVTGKEIVKGKAANALDTTANVAGKGFLDLTGMKREGSAPLVDHSVKFREKMGSIKDDIFVKAGSFGEGFKQTPIGQKISSGISTFKDKFHTTDFLKNMGGKLASSKLSLGAMATGLGISALGSTDFGREHSNFMRSLMGVGTILGSAGTGATVGGFLGPIGALIGATVGGIYGAIKGIPMIINGIENAFRDTFNNIYLSVASFPEKITSFISNGTAWLDKSIQKFPEFISNLFSMPDPSEVTIDPETGQPIGDSPSILWKITKAIGASLWTIVANIPKMATTLIGAAISGIGMAIAGIAGLIVEGVVRSMKWASNGISDGFSNGIRVLQKAFTVEIPSFLGGGTIALLGRPATDEEINQARAERDKKDNADIEKIKAGTKDYMQFAGKVGTDFSKTINSTLGFDALGKTGSSYAADLKQNAIFTKYMDGDAKGNIDAAEVNYAKGELKMSEQDILKAKEDGSWKDKVKSFREQYEKEKPERDAIYERRYQDWLKYNSKEDNADNRNAFDMRESASKFNKNLNLAPTDIEGLIANVALQNGIDPNLMIRIAQIESSMNPNASNSTSSAKGLFQFTNSTGKLFGLMNDDDFFNPEKNTLAAAKYIKNNIAYLRGAGIPITPATVYLAHQQGPAGLAAIFNSINSGRPLPDSIIKNMANNNPGLSAEDVTNPAKFMAAWESKLGATSDTSRLLASSTTSALQTIDSSRSLTENINQNSNEGLIDVSSAIYGGIKNQAVLNSFNESIDNKVTTGDATPAVDTPVIKAQANISNDITNKAMTTAAANASTTETATNAVMNNVVKSSGNPLLDELRIQTQLLTAISDNTLNTVNVTKTIIANNSNIGVNPVNGTASNTTNVSINTAQKDMFSQTPVSTPRNSITPNPEAIRIASGNTSRSSTIGL